MNRIISWLSEYMLASAGLPDEQIAEAVTLRELHPEIKASLANAGIAERFEAMRTLALYRNTMSATQFEETMTVAHFTQYFGDAISRAFYADYAYQRSDLDSYVSMDTAPDFRAIDRYRMTEPEGLLLRREKAEEKATYIADSEITISVEEYSRQFDVSWRAIQNDDLGKIRETPQRMARAARRWYEQWGSALYDNAVTQAGLVALGAAYAGTGRLTAANLAIGLNAMMSRVDVNGNPIGITRVHLVIPPILKIQAADILGDILAYGGAGGNVLANFMSEVYVDPYIATAAPNVPWYLFADPSEIPTVPVVRMDGWPGPVVAQKAPDMRVISGTAPSAFSAGSFATGDISFLVEDVVGGWNDATYVGVGDFQGIYYSSGTTP